MNSAHSTTGPGNSRRTVGYEENPGSGERPVVGAGSGFDATLIGEGVPPHPLPDRPAVPRSPGESAASRPPGFQTTALGATEVSLDATTLAPSDTGLVSIGTTTLGSGPTSVSASQLPRSTVLPRVELRDGQPFVLHSDRLRYQHRKKLGEGGVGEVHMAHDNDIERSVAVKRLRPEMLGTSALSRFVEEIRTVGQLEHPGIVPVHDVGLDEQGQFYFVMKYVEGDTLEQIIEKLAAGDPEAHHRFPFERRVEIFKGILEAMAYAHDKGIVHRDLKPANIMVGPYGEVVVMDWGLAKKVGQAAIADLTAEPDQEPAGADDVQRSRRLHQTRVGSLLGTPLYMSPEQARGQHDTLDQRSDIYSLSVLFHEFLLLRHQLHGRTDLAQVIHAVVTEEINPNTGWSSPHQSPVPADLRHFVIKGLQKDPAQRYSTVREMLERLERRAEGDVPCDCLVTFSMRTMGEGRKLLSHHPLAATGALVLLVATSAASMIYSAVHLLFT